jgi:serine/threonine protein kinase
MKEFEITDFGPATTQMTGGFSTVTVHRHQATRTLIAIKKENDADGAAECTHNEVDILSSLNHKHIIPLLGTIALGKITGIVLRYADGSSLKELLKEENRKLIEEENRKLNAKNEAPSRKKSSQLYSKLTTLFGKRKASKPSPMEDLEDADHSLHFFNITKLYMLHVAFALEYIHRKGICHRDLKPANVLIDTDLKTGKKLALLCDFGLAQETGELSGASGTIYYMPPEVIAKHSALKPIDETLPLHPSFDCFSFGQLMVVMCSGGPDPYKFPADMPKLTIRHNIATGAAEKYLTLAGPMIPGGIKSLINQCRLFNSCDRPTATDLVRELRLSSPKKTTLL